MTRRERATYDLLLRRLAEFVGDPTCHPVNDLREVIALDDRIPMRLILRKVPGESQRAKARTAKVSPQTWYRWARGHRPDKDQAAKLAKLTGFSVSQIAEGA